MRYKALCLSTTALAIGLIAAPATAQTSAQATTPPLRQGTPTVVLNTPAQKTPSPNGSQLPNIGTAESVRGQDVPTRTDDVQGLPEAAVDPDKPATLPEGDSPPAKAKAIGKEDGTITVTGSRLQTGDVTSRLIVIDQAEIRARGVTSVEELIRTLPQNVATIGAITNDRAGSGLGDRRTDRDVVSSVGSLGVAAANLGGVGAGNTLILINGRRVAGAAGIQDGFANLNGIPLSAIERVEISTGGASAVYGADALGGVINFVLKQGFVGTTITGQFEDSNNGADNGRVSIYSGYGWKTGNMSVTAEYGRRSPINNFKTGYTTENYSSYFNNDPAYDFRSFARGLQPGVIDRSTSVFNAATGTFTNVVQALTVPAGFTGIPRVSDFITIGADARPDYVPELAGPRVETASASFNFEQKIFDKLIVFGNGLYNRSRNVQEQRAGNGVSLALAPGQAFNPFPAFTFSTFSPQTTVLYYPAAEIAEGTIPPSRIRSLSTQWSVNGGFRYEFSTNSKFELVYTTSQSETSANSTVFGSLAQLTRSTTSPNGVTCGNFQLANNPTLYSATQLAYLQQVLARQCAALTSSDPAQAFNPFRSSSSGLGVSTDVFLYRDVVEDRQSRLQNVEARLNGRLLALPAGGLYYAIGADLNDDGVDSREVRLFTGQRVSRDRHAFFGELTIPILGNGYDLPLMKTLTFNLAARRDIYDTEGAIGTVGGISIDRGGEIVYGKNRFARTTPAFGVRYEPFSGMSLRARWTRGFQAPPYTQLFNVIGTQTQQAIIFNASDPIYQCTADCTAVFGTTRGYYVPRLVAPNPDLKPQTSRQEVFSAVYAPTNFLRGLNLAVTYNRNRIFNQYADATDLTRFLTQTQAYQLSQFYPRDANGKILAFNSQIFNLTGSRFESITYEASYRFRTGIGTFEPRITYLDNLKAEAQPFANSQVYSTMGTLSGVDRYKIVGGLNWSYGDFNTNLYVYHTPSYINDYLIQIRGGTLTNPTIVKDVRAYTTFDLTGSWQIRKDLRLDLAARNMFDATPPFTVVETRPYDTARYNVAGRTLSLQLQFSF